jgi:hypothetical protein
LIRVSGEFLYLDSSALVKLVLPEAESSALLESLQTWPVRLASELAHVEVVRAVRRATVDPEVERRAEEVLAGLYLIKLDGDIIGQAARLEPRTLRSLDALHLATALSLGDDLGAIVVYDSGLATAAAGYGLKVIAPGTSLPPADPES